MHIKVICYIHYTKMQFFLGWACACSHQVFWIWPGSLAVSRNSDGTVSWFSSPFWSDAKITITTKYCVIFCCIRCNMISFKSDQSASVLMALSCQFSHYLIQRKCLRGNLRVVYPKYFVNGIWLQLSTVVFVQFWYRFFYRQNKLESIRTVNIANVATCFLWSHPFKY